MSSEWRDELQGYVNRHEADPYAHAAMRHGFRNEMVGEFMSHGTRLDKLEQWQQRIIGAVAMLTFLASVGVIAAVVRWFTK